MNDKTVKHVVRHVSNPLHLANCKNRVQVQRDRTRYTRKEKHRKRYA